VEKTIMRALRMIVGQPLCEENNIVVLMLKWTQECRE